MMTTAPTAPTVAPKVTPTLERFGGEGDPVEEDDVMELPALVEGAVPLPVEDKPLGWAKRLPANRDKASRGVDDAIPATVQYGTPGPSCQLGP
jgi:hypothetical protein